MKLTLMNKFLLLSTVMMAMMVGKAVGTADNRLRGSMDGMDPTCHDCGCPPSDPDCRRQLEASEVRVLAYQAWKDQQQQRQTSETESMDPSCHDCGCPMIDPDCRRHLDKVEGNVLAFQAWKQDHGME